MQKNWDQGCYSNRPNELWLHLNRLPLNSVLLACCDKRFVPNKTCKVPGTSTWVAVIFQAQIMTIVWKQIEYILFWFFSFPRQFVSSFLFWLKISFNWLHHNKIVSKRHKSILNHSSTSSVKMKAHRHSSMWSTVDFVLIHWSWHEWWTLCDILISFIMILLHAHHWNSD